MAAAFSPFLVLEINSHGLLQPPASGFFIPLPESYQTLPFSCNNSKIGSFRSSSPHSLQMSYVQVSYKEILLPTVAHRT